MFKNCGFIVGKNDTFMKRIIGKTTLKVFAEESSNTEPTGGENNNDKQPAPFNYEDLIAKARKEEKDKQFKKISGLESQNTTLINQHNDDLVRIADLETQLQVANDKITKIGSGDSEEIKQLKETISSLQKTNEELDKKIKGFESAPPVNRDDVVNEVRAELEKEYEVKTYKTTKLLELKDEILVPELVFGNTKEEIDASIENALSRSAEIKKSLGVDTKREKKTPRTPANPDTSSIQEKEISYEQLASMDPASKEYAELRRKLGLR